jgi:hypothetical protein
MAVSLALKRERSPSFFNNPLVVLYGEFVIPAAAATYHLWDLPAQFRVLDGYVDVTVAGVHGAGNPAAELSILAKDDAADPDDTTERVINVADTNSAAINRMQSSKQLTTGSDGNKVLAYYRGTTQDTSGETIRVMIQAIRDDILF